MMIALDPFGSQAKPQMRERPPGVSRAAFAYVVMTSAYAALVPILRVSQARSQARAQDGGATAPMGKRLDGEASFTTPGRDAAPAGHLR